MTKTNETPKRNAAIKTEVHTKWISGLADNSVGLTLTFSHGKVLQLSAGDLTEEIRREALAHGLKQKLVDAAAIPHNTTTGRAATIEDKYSAVRDVYTRLLSGLWNEPREGGGNVGGLLLKALCRIFPTKTADELKARLAGMSEVQKVALRANPKVAAAIQAIQAEAAELAGIDSDELLDAMGGEDETSK